MHVPTGHTARGSAADAVDFSITPQPNEHLYWNGAPMEDHESREGSLPGGPTPRCSVSSHSRNIACRGLKVDGTPASRWVCGRQAPSLTVLHCIAGNACLLAEPFAAAHRSRVRKPLQRRAMPTWLDCRNTTTSSRPSGWVSELLGPLSPFLLPGASAAGPFSRRRYRSRPALGRARRCQQDAAGCGKRAPACSWGPWGASFGRRRG